MHYPLTDIQADFGINRLFRYQITAKRNYLQRRQTDNKYFLKEKNAKKREEKWPLSNIIYIYLT